MKHIVKTTSLILTAALCLGACSSAPAQETTSATSAETTTETTTEATTEPTVPTETTSETSEPTETTALVSDYDQPAITISPEQLEALRPYEGKWNRTNTHSGNEATLNISEMDETGFNFSGFFSHFANFGEITDCRAEFISENEAVYKNGDDINAAPSVYVLFTFENDGIKIDVDGDTATLPLGACVFVTGEYTVGEPIYTNTNIVEELFTEEDLTALKELLGDGYEEPFISDTKTGAVITTNTSMGRYIQCMMPGVADYMGYELIITDDGKIYYKRVDGTLITNDADYEGDEFPEYTII